MKEDYFKDVFTNPVTELKVKSKPTMTRSLSRHKSSSANLFFQNNSTEEEGRAASLNTSEKERSTSNSKKRIREAYGKVTQKRLEHFAKKSSESTLKKVGKEGGKRIPQVKFESQERSIKPQMPQLINKTQKYL